VKEKALKGKRKMMDIENTRSYYEEN